MTKNYDPVLDDGLPPTWTEDNDDIFTNDEDDFEFDDDIDQYDFEEDEQFLN